MEYLKNKFLDKILYNGIYQCIGSAKIDYHASLFFVYKFTKYLRFFPDGKLCYIDRMEGQKYDDNDSSIVYNLLEVCDRRMEIKDDDWNENLIGFNLNEIECKCGPSILSELINTEDNFTQIFVNYTYEHREQTDIYTFQPIKS